MSRLRPIDVRRRRPTWLDDDLPPAPLGSARAEDEAHRDFLQFHDEQLVEDDNRPSPSYRRPED